MKSHLSLFRIIVLSFLVFSDCTLYMDDPEGLRVLRTEEGYLEPVQLDLPEMDGYIIYKYNQKTIAIEDEVEKWVERVESDTIVWFSSETPDYYLPEVGEMMTCSIRDKFPDGFCHRCIERTNTNGLYRCVFTPCSIFDAFDEFEAQISPSAFITGNEAESRELTDEEFDSLMYGGSSTAETKAVITRAGGDKEDDEEKKRVPLVKKTVGFPGGKLIASTGSSGLSGSATYGGNLVVKGYADVAINKKTDEFRFDLKLEGRVNFWVDLEAKAGVTVKVPDDILISGVEFDFKKIHIRSGFFVSPYFTVEQQIKGRLDLSWKFNDTFSLLQVGNSSKNSPSVKENGSGCSSPEATFKGSLAPTLHVKSGIDIFLDLGADALGYGEEAKAGVDFYTELNQDIDVGKYESAEDFKQKNANFPLMAKIYFTKTLKKGYVSHEEELLGIDPIKVSDKLLIPFMPEIDPGMKSTNFYCENYNEKRYKIFYKLKTVGLIGYLLDYLPYLRIYDEEGKMLKEIKLDLKENLTAGQKTWVDETGVIKKNTKYTVQVGFKSHGLYWLPLHEIPFTYDWPDVYMYGAEVVALRKGESVEKGYKFEWYGKKSEEYDYLYIIDVDMGMAGLRSIGKWGIDMTFPFYDGVSSPPVYRFYRKVDSDMSKLEKADVRVRFYWYTNHGYNDWYGNWNPSLKETVTFKGIFTVINNGKESGFRYIDNIHTSKAWTDVYYDKSMDRELTKEEVKEFKSDPFSFDMLEHNQNKDFDRFSYQDPRTNLRKKSSSIIRQEIDYNDDLIVVDVYE